MEEEFLQPEESSVDSWNTDEITSGFSARTTEPEDIYMQLWEIESVCVHVCTTTVMIFIL